MTGSKVNADSVFPGFILVDHEFCHQVHHAYNHKIQHLENLREEHKLYIVQ